MCRRTARRSECELPEYRSVLVQVHALGRPPTPVPVVPVGWDKFKIRCCSYKSELLQDALLGDLLDGKVPGLKSLPAPVREQALKWLRKAVEMIVKKNRKLSK